jgi:hypothetical protein
MDLIVASSGPSAIAAKQATKTIPVVMMNVSDPVALGIVANQPVRSDGAATGRGFGVDIAVVGLAWGPGTQQKRDTKKGPLRQEAGMAPPLPNSAHGDQLISAKPRGTGRFLSDLHM